jgi:hypothetical protein
VEVEGLGEEDGEVEAWGLALMLEPEEQQGYKRWGREESKSQLEGILGFFLFVFFSSSLSGNRTTVLCLQQRPYSISS